jgi:hypothetical protein
MKAIYEAVCNMAMANGDEIKQGTKSYRVLKGMAYFKTKNGYVFAFVIYQMDKSYFK